MGIYPLFFLLLVLGGWLCAIFRGPIWALVTYVFIYFNIPSHQWWGGQVPDLRWSLIAAAILIVSCIIHSSKLSSLKWSQNRPGLILFLLLLLMMMIALVSDRPDLTWQRAYDFFRYVLVFFLIGSILQSLKKFKLFVFVLVGCTSYLAVLAHHYFRGGRLDGVGLPDASDANMLAALVLLLLPLFVAIIVSEKRYLQILTVVSLVIVVNMFIMCGSRGAFMGLIVEVVVGLFLMRQRIGFFRSFVICSLVVGCLLGLMSDEYKDRLLNLGKSSGESTITEQSAGRWEIWSLGFQMVRDNPWGSGGGSFMAMSPDYLPDYLLTGQKENRVRASHNTFLLVLVEQGVLGLIIFLVFLSYQFFLLWRIRRLLQDSNNMSLYMPDGAIMNYNYALTTGLSGFWAASFFIDRLYFEAIYLANALVPVLWNFTVNEHERIHVLERNSEGEKEGTISLQRKADRQ